MKFLWIFLTYNRPTIAGQSLNSLFTNTQIAPEEVWIVDDGSRQPTQRAIIDFAMQNSKPERPINLCMAGRNYGIGYSFERAYNIMRMSDADVVCFVESDYIWRKGWAEDVEAVFEASPHTIAIAGCNHPDMYQREKTHGEFCKLMVDQFGRDLKAREHLYAPFKLETKNGPIEVQGVSNSCGCQIVHWGRLRKIFQDLNLEIDYWKWMDRAFHKNGTGDRRLASDAHMSGTLSMYAEMWMEHHGVDITKNFGFLDICDYSISAHVCGGGINGMICPEGSTFIISPKWDNQFLKNNPRMVAYS